MNYRILYDRLIQKAKARLNLDGYFELHHIVPRSMGGGNAAENLVELTAREHFLAHWLLFRTYKNRETALAFRLMIHDRKLRRGRDYAIARIVMADGMKGGNNVARREKVRDKIRESLARNHPYRGTKRPQHAEKMRGRFTGSKNPAYGKGYRQLGELNASAKVIHGFHTQHGHKTWGTATFAANELGVSVQAVVQAIRKNFCSKGWKLNYAEAR